MKLTSFFQIGLAQVLVIALGCGLLVSSQAWPIAQPQTQPQPQAVPMSNTRQVELIRLVRQDCGSCHGLTLKGGLGPALLPDSLRDVPVENLLAVILHGRPGTAMPAWKRFLSEEEARWIVAQLQKGFPHEKP